MNHFEAFEKVIIIIFKRYPAGCCLMAISSKIGCSPLRFPRLNAQSMQKMILFSLAWKAFRVRSGDALFAVGSDKSSGSTASWQAILDPKINSKRTTVEELECSWRRLSGQKSTWLVENPNKGAWQNPSVKGHFGLLTPKVAMPRNAMQQYEPRIALIDIA